MLSTQSDSFPKIYLPNLLKYGLDENEAKIYLFLLENSAKPALKISRELKLARTKVYRILDKLTEKGLVAHELQSAGLKFLAESPQKLSLLLTAQEKAVQQLEAQHSQLVTQLETLAQAYSSGGSEVRYYSGLDGLKQVTYNSLSAKKQLLIYELNQDMSKFVDYEFAESVRAEMAEKAITTFQLTNLTQILPHTEVSKLVQEFWQVRYIPPKDFKIDFEVLIYNNIYALYTYQHGEAFCVEIHNPFLAKMQRQLFKFIWKRAQALKVMDRFGRAELPIKVTA